MVCSKIFEILPNDHTLEAMEPILAFFGDHQSIVTTVSLLSALFFVGSLLVIPILIARLPTNYFVEKHRLAHGESNPRSFSETVLVVLKNIVGVILIIAGIAMLVLPGQGLLTILIGFSLTNFPGKYALERRLVSKPAIFHSLNWIRKKSGKPPLEPQQVINIFDLSNN